MTQDIIVTCNPFPATERRGRYKVRIEADGTVSVWDSVAGHYTACHTLTTSSLASIRRIARLAGDASPARSS